MRTCQTSHNGRAVVRAAAHSRRLVTARRRVLAGTSQTAAATLTYVVVRVSALTCIHSIPIQTAEITNKYDFYEHSNSKLAGFGRMRSVRTVSPLASVDWALCTDRKEDKVSIFKASQPEELKTLSPVWPPGSGRTTAAQPQQSSGKT